MWNRGEDSARAETVRSASSDASAVDGAAARRRGDAVHDERPAETRAEAGDVSRATSSRPPTRRRRRSRFAADATVSPARMLKSRIARGDVSEEGGGDPGTSTHTTDVISRYHYDDGHESTRSLHDCFVRPPSGSFVGVRLWVHRNLRRTVSSDAAAGAPHTRARARHESRRHPATHIVLRPSSLPPPAPKPPRVSPLHHSSGRGAFYTFPTSCRERHLHPVNSATPSR